MPWNEVTVMSLRKEFVMLALTPESSIRQLCRRFGIARKTGYKWIQRFLDEGDSGLADESRRPRYSPRKIPVEMEKAILRVREAHATWGGRKIRRDLQNQGHQKVPAASTISDILSRNGRLDPDESFKHMPFQRFERSKPNALWQMDFKGHVPCPEGRCHPFTVLDDCSRYAITLKACGDETGITVHVCLTEAFRYHGLPWQMLMDNGSPWGSDQEHIYTPLTVWLMRLGIVVSHCRAYHPQTQGKEERFHRTLKAELVGVSIPWPRVECQQRFDQWRTAYNWERPHEALDMDVPGSHYRISERPFPEQMPEVEYGPEDIVRKVQQGGHLFYQGREYTVPKAFYGQPVALRPRAQEDGILDVFYCQQKIAVVHLSKHD